MVSVTPESSVLAPPPEPPQAARARIMTSARRTAIALFFILFFLSKIYSLAQRMKRYTKHVINLSHAGPPVNTLLNLRAAFFKKL
jgi:hypothetical protein